MLGNNPGSCTELLAEAFATGFGLQTGHTDRLQVEVAELLCDRLHADKVRFTTSGSLATMYAIMLARAFTGRDLVLKVGDRLARRAALGPPRRLPATEGTRPGGAESEGPARRRSPTKSC